MAALFSRQPIFDRQSRVWAYELLTSGGPLPAGGLEPGPSEVSGDADGGLFQVESKLAAGKRLWLQGSPDFFLGETCRRLPPELVVLEVPEEAGADPGLLAALKHWRQAGYLLAVGPAAWPKWAGSPLADVIGLVKADLKELLPAQRSALSAWCASRQVPLVAANLQTRREFREALKDGCTFGQGPFYGRLTELSRQGPPRYKLNYVKLLNELGQSTLDFPRFAALIQSNPPLVHKLLHYLNSVFFGLPCRVSSVPQALLLLGEQELRKWTAMAIIHHLGEDQPEEVLRLSLVRARLGELLAVRGGVGESSELFLTGLLSLLDVYLGRSLAEVLADMPLSTCIKETLQGVPGPHRQVFALVLALERAAWDEAAGLAGRLGLPGPDIAAAYLEALESAEQAHRCWSG